MIIIAMVSAFITGFFIGKKFSVANNNKKINDIYDAVTDLRDNVDIVPKKTNSFFN